MFYFDNFYGKKILKSNYINDITAFFTTREGIDFENISDSLRIIRPEQTHSCNVDIIDERFNYPDTDALILNNKNDVLVLKFADCTPLIFYDSKNGYSAIAHAGWRGTAGMIGVKTINRMMDMGSKAEDITVLIGPAISKCCYEVGEEVREKLLLTVNNDESFCIGKKVDLKGINARQLFDAGIKKIDICPYCTVCNNDLFFSYRKENATTNRHYAVVKL